MTERKPPELPWESWVEQQIREAQEAGEFDHLPGMGRPIPSLDDPDDQWWWIKRKLRREKLSLLPPALEIRLVVQRQLQRIWQLPSEQAVRREVSRVNEKIRQANLAAVWGPPSTTMPLDADEVVRRWAERRRRQS